MAYNNNHIVKNEDGYDLVSVSVLYSDCEDCAEECSHASLNTEYKIVFISI